MCWKSGGVPLVPYTFSCRFAGKETELSFRPLPCACESCLVDDFNNCLDREYVRIFKPYRMRAKGMRAIRWRGGKKKKKTAKGLDVSGEWAVLSIKGRRYHRGVLQYLVEWEGDWEDTWTNEDKLSCPELVEEFEIEGCMY